MHAMFYSLLSVTQFKPSDKGRNDQGETDCLRWQNQKSCQLFQVMKWWNIVGGSHTPIQQN